jgi:hypothetical protein
MSYPNTIDTFTPVTDRGQSITESITVSSVAPFTGLTTYQIQNSTTVTISGLTQTVSTPGTGQFQVVYASQTINFSSFSAGQTYTVTYFSNGSQITKALFNPEYTAVTNVETTLGINPQGSYTDVATRLTAIASSTAHPQGYDDVTSQLTPANNIIVFNLTHAPIVGTQTVTLNGLMMARQDYVIIGTQLKLAMAPLYSIDHLVISYLY